MPITLLFVKSRQHGLRVPGRVTMSRVLLLYIQGTYPFETNFQNSFKKTDWPQIVSNHRLDLWICHHFRVLPTEKRFKRLTEKQKVLLLHSWIELPTSEQLKAVNHDESRLPAIDDTTEENLLNVGYTQEQIDTIKEQIADGRNNN